MTSALMQHALPELEKLSLDVKALQSGTADEEEARLSGFAKASEKLYLVTAAPSPSPAPSTSPKSHQ